jgi:hypothetical protein
MEENNKTIKQNKDKLASFLKEIDIDESDLLAQVRYERNI